MPLVNTQVFGSGQNFTKTGNIIDSGPVGPGNFWSVNVPFTVDGSIFQLTFGIDFDELDAPDECDFNGADPFYNVLISVSRTVGPCEGEERQIKISGNANITGSVTGDCPGDTDTFTFTGIDGTQRDFEDEFTVSC